MNNTHLFQVNEANGIRGIVQLHARAMAGRITVGRQLHIAVTEYVNCSHYDFREEFV